MKHKESDGLSAEIEALCHEILRLAGDERLKSYEEIPLVIKTIKEVLTLLHESESKGKQ
jgi:hypothetical protein